MPKPVYSGPPVATVEHFDVGTETGVKAIILDQKGCETMLDNRNKKKGGRKKKEKIAN